MNMIKLLLVEDDANLSYIVQSGLEEIIGGYEVVTAVNGLEGLKVYQEEKPDVIITDIEMPVMDGFDMVARIRETDGETPILFASGRLSPKDVTSGYKLGANNYIKKPFIPQELDAHIQALLKLKEGVRSRNETSLYKIGGFVLDAGHATLKAVDGNARLLTVREAQLLELLAQNKGEVVKRGVILSRFWDTENDYFASRSLDVFITNLRKMFASDSSVEIKTVKGVGLMLVVPDSSD